MLLALQNVQGVVHIALIQARNQLGIPGRAKSFLGGAQIFQNMSNSFKLCPTHFSRKKCRGTPGPPGYEPAFICSATFKL